MREFYTVTKHLNDILLADPDCNSVYMSTSIQEIDINKQNIYPMAYIILGDADIQSNVINFSFNVICFDIVDQLKHGERYRNEVETGDSGNVSEIWNTQLAVTNRMLNTLRRGSDTVNFELLRSSPATPFKNRFENLLAGYSVELTITVPNTEICING